MKHLEDLLNHSTTASKTQAEDSGEAGQHGDPQGSESQESGPRGSGGDKNEGDKSRGDKSEDADHTGQEAALARLLPEEEIGTWAQEAGESVRTTFRLSPEAIHLFGRLSDRIGKTQKNLLGEALRLCRRAWEEDAPQVQEVASRYRAIESKEKPMAIASATREGLNDLASQADLPRNHLVEVGIRLVELSLKKAARKKLGPHEDILEELKALYGKIEQVQVALSSARTQNRSDGYEDPVLSALFDIMWTVEQMARATEEAVRSGEPLEESREFP